MTQDEQKELAGRAVAYHPLIKNSIVIGVGAGTTVWDYFIPELGKRVRKKGGLMGIKTVPTSKKTKKLCKDNKIKVVSLESVDKIDIAVDGADEVDDGFNLIKGGGGAHTNEKKVDYQAEHFVVIVDESKMSRNIGEKFKIPVEVEKWRWRDVQALLAKKICRNLTLRKKEGSNEPFVTDNENYIIDLLRFIPILNPASFERRINKVSGVVENGIFRKNKVHEVWIGHDEKLEKRKRVGRRIVIEFVPREDLKFLNS